MATQTVRKGEAKTMYITPFGEDLTGFTATSITVYFTGPLGGTFNKTGTLVDATTGQVSWAMGATDFNTDGAGEYQFMTKCVGASGTKWSPLEFLRVEGTL